ncbi:hypothetical protein TRFO_23572 [Tritrichomonas foetus]|uniref:Uncharacterized protein n=1 Tax=Tritrichomonas foetus TaxID=1144522 RepID=A0A1J4K969_9EUKA|nr:hypothetical protein TRFO_23572 [Tritrichomonas foetus]|eukprot:OHT08041.1 hypothetical protein TRFO_23572 [Tritrichomonas foetus]
MTALLNILKNDDLSGLVSIIQNEDLSYDSVFRLRSIRVPDILKREPTLVCATAFFGATKCFRYLFSNAANLDLKDSLGRNITHFACAGGNDEILNILYLNNFSFNLVDVSGNTCVHYAVMYHRINVVYWLWSVIGESLSTVNKHGISPLHIAVLNEEVGILEFLCQNGCNINQRNDLGETPLHFAAKKSNGDVVWRLLKNGADVTLKDNVGCMPYQCATFQHIQSILIA